MSPSEPPPGTTAIEPAPHPRTTKRSLAGHRRASSSVVVEACSAVPSNSSGSSLEASAKVDRTTVTSPVRSACTTAATASPLGTAITSEISRSLVRDALSSAPICTTRAPSHDGCRPLIVGDEDVDTLASLQAAHGDLAAREGDRDLVHRLGGRCIGDRRGLDDLAFADRSESDATHEGLDLGEPRGVARQLAVDRAQVARPRGPRRGGSARAATTIGSREPGQPARRPGTRRRRRPPSGSRPARRGCPVAHGVARDLHGGPQPSAVEEA